MEVTTGGSGSEKQAALHHERILFDVKEGVALAELVEPTLAVLFLEVDKKQ